MSSDISTDSEAYIADAIARGVYRNRADVIDAGLAMLRRHESLLAWIDEGRRQLDEGEYVELDDDGLKELMERLKERARLASKSK